MPPPTDPADPSDPTALEALHALGTVEAQLADGLRHRETYTTRGLLSVFTHEPRDAVRVS